LESAPLVRITGSKLRKFHSHLPRPF
jgi:hypothetical protein